MNSLSAPTEILAARIAELRYARAQITEQLNERLRCKHAANVKCTLALLLILAACGDGDSSSPPSPAAVPTVTLTSDATGGTTSQQAAVSIAAATATAKTLASGVSVGYRKTGSVALGNLDPVLATETGLVVTQAAGGGPAMQFALGASNVLYFLAPEEQFGDSSSTLSVTNATGTQTWNVTFAWSGRVTPSNNRIEEADENGQEPPADNVAISTSGVGEYGDVSSATTSLTINLDGVPALDPTLVTVELSTAAGAQDVSTWFTYDAAAGHLDLDPSHLAGLLSAVQTAKTATLVFSLSTAGYESTFGYEQVLTYSDGIISLSVVDGSGAPVTTMAGTTFVVSGFNTGVTATTQVDGNGKATIQRLPGDTYQVSQALLAPGNPLVGFATLPDAASTVSLTIDQSATSAPSGSHGRAAARSIWTHRSTQRTSTAHGTGGLHAVSCGTRHSYCRVAGAKG